MSDENNMAAVIAAARQSVGITMVPGLDHAAYVPTPEKGHIEDLQKYFGSPRRKSGTVVVFDAGSFNEIVDANADTGTPRVYVNRDVASPSIIGILNDHGENPGWRDLRVQLEFRQTPQWQKWRAMDGKMVGQADFAEFIEENLADLAQPTGAEMLEIVTYLQATRSTEFKSGIRLSNGNLQFVNVENTTAKVGAGQIEVPEKFELAITPFQGLPLFAVPARFRYRLNGGVLTMGLKLERIENLMNQVLGEAMSQITCPNIVEGRP